jgi:hypothetical protein
MTQDQYGQARGSGYVVPGDVVPEDETEEARTDESRPMTRFQKVASALRGGSERDEQDLDTDDQVADNRLADDQVAAERASADRTAAEAQAGAPESNPPWVTREDEAAMADSPIAREPAQKRDYWDDPNAAAGHEHDAVAVTSPDIPADHQATDPDMLGTSRRTGEETAEMPAARAEGQPGAATIADVPAARTPMGEPPASDAPVAEAPVTETPADDVAAPAGDVPAGDVPAGDVPATAGDATGSTGRHAAATTSADAAATSASSADAQLRPGEAADPGLRPGEAAGKLGDFSDLTYGNLVPDAQQFTAQWQEIQFRFVDDPRGSVTEAADIVAQVTAKMEAAIQERQRAIEERQHAIAEQQRSLRGRWGEDSNADTEALRETLRMYKTFLDQLIGSRTS